MTVINYYGELIDPAITIQVIDVAAELIKQDDTMMLLPAVLRGCEVIIHCPEATDRDDDLKFQAFNSTMKSLRLALNARWTLTPHILPEFCDMGSVWYRDMAPMGKQAVRLFRLIETRSKLEALSVA